MFPFDFSKNCTYILEIEQPKTGNCYFWLPLTFYWNILKSPVMMSTLRALLNLPTDLLSDLFSPDEQSALWFYQTLCWRGESSQVINMSSNSPQSLRTSSYERWFHSQLRGWILENENILKGCVINTKQIYKTYSVERSWPADFIGSHLLWAVMVISMLFTPSALLAGHVSKTNSTSKFQSK